MSYIGRLPVKVPANVSIDISTDNKSVYVKGPLGSKQTSEIPGVSYDYSDESKQKISVQIENKKFKKFWGLARTQVADLVKGVSRGFSITLDLVGVGYKAEMGESLNGRPLPLLEEELTNKYGNQSKTRLDELVKTGEKTPNLTLKLGFSHDIFLNIPAGVSVKCPNYSQIVLEGNDKNTLSQFAADIRKFRRPEPYKGKGILFKGEVVQRKQGKN